MTMPRGRVAHYFNTFSCVNIIPVDDIAFIKWNYRLKIKLNFPDNIISICAKIEIKLKH